MMTRRAFIGLQLSPHGPEFDSDEQKLRLQEAILALQADPSPLEAERLHWQIDNYIVVQGSRGPHAYLLLSPLLAAVAGATDMGREKLLDAVYELYFSRRKHLHSSDGEPYERSEMKEQLLAALPMLRMIHSSGSPAERAITEALLAVFPNSE